MGQECLESWDPSVDVSSIESIASPGFHFEDGSLAG